MTNEEAARLADAVAGYLRTGKFDLDPPPKLRQREVIWVEYDNVGNFKHFHRSLPGQYDGRNTLVKYREIMSDD